MEFIRLDPAIDDDPDLQDAGWVGARVYELLLKICGKRDLRGRIPVKLQRRDWLAAQWNLQPTDLEALGVPLERRDPAQLVELGLRALHQVSAELKANGGGTPLLLVEEDGTWLLPGWAKVYGTGTSTYRTRKLRGLDPITGERPGNAGTGGNAGTPGNGYETRRDETEKGLSSSDQPAPPPAPLRPLLELTPQAAPAVPPPVAPKVRKKSRQELAASWFWGERAKQTDETDKPLKPAALNTVVKEVLLDLGEPGFKSAARAYLADPYGRTMSPPWPLSFFLAEFRRYRGKGLPPGADAAGGKVTDDVDPYRSGTSG